MSLWDRATAWALLASSVVFSYAISGGLLWIGWNYGVTTVARTLPAVTFGACVAIAVLIRELRTLVKIR